MNTRKNKIAALVAIMASLITSIPLSSKTSGVEGISEVWFTVGTFFGTMTLIFIPSAIAFLIRKNSFSYVVYIFTFIAILFFILIYF